MYLQPKRMILTVACFASFLCLSGMGFPRLVLAEMSTPSDTKSVFSPTGWKPGAIQTKPAYAGYRNRGYTNRVCYDSLGELQPRVKQVTPPLGEDDKPPTTPAGPRDDCLVGEKPLKALIPATAGNVGITVAAYPTFFVYIPENQAVEAEFILKDVNEDSVVYQRRVRLPRTPGVMSLSVPTGADVKELQVQKDYRWTFALVCKSKNGKENTDNFVNGIIQRVNRPDLEKRVREASVREVPSIYAKEGIWHDLLASLAKLRRDNPNDAELAESWAKLLSDVGLADVAKEPLVQSYSFTPPPLRPPSRGESPSIR